MIKIDKLFQLIVVVLSFLIMLEIFDVFDEKKEIRYSEKEVALIIKIKGLNEKIENLINENEIIEKDNERIKNNIGSDSISVWDGSREFRDSLRAELFR